MFGLVLFKNIYFNLSERSRNKILGNIFKINNVSVSDLIVNENRCFIRMFSNNVFYNYLLIMGTGKNSVVYNERIVECRIFVYNEREEMGGGSEFIYQLIRCCDESQVYRLVKQFL